MQYMLYFVYYYTTIYNCYITTIRHSLYCITLCLCYVSIWCEHHIPSCLCSHHSLLKNLSSLTVELSFYYIVHSSYFCLKCPEELNKYANNWWSSTQAEHLAAKNDKKKIVKNRGQLFCLFTSGLPQKNMLLNCHRGNLWFCIVGAN